VGIILRHDLVPKEDRNAVAADQLELSQDGLVQREAGKDYGRAGAIQQTGDRSFGLAANALQCAGKSITVQSPFEQDKREP
jgi:hypothetical protein